MTSSLDFVGPRLTLARAFEGVTLKELADRTTVSVASLGHYESGLRRQPTEDLVQALAEALGVKPGFFYQALPDVWEERECSFRRRVATPEGVKKRARAHGTLLGLVVKELVGAKARFPDYNIPALKAENSEDIETAAEHCRDRWGLGLGPVQHVGRVAERNGAILVQHLRHADKIDAFSRRGPFSMIVLNTARRSTSRWIFDVAHELGHFVLHTGIATGSRETEEQANAFASAFLLPRRTFGREFGASAFSWTHVFALKRRWYASAAAIIRRAFTLRLLDGIAYRRCYQHLSFKGWLKGEPHEPDFVGPEWMPSAFGVAARCGGITPAELCDRLQLTPAVFSDVTGLMINTPTPARFRPRLVRT